LNQVINLPHLSNIRLNPKVRIVKGIEYLEWCVNAKKLVPLSVSPTLENPAPFPLFPMGVMIVVATDLLLSEKGLLQSLVELLKGVKVSSNQRMKKNERTTETQLPMFVLLFYNRMIFQMWSSSSIRPR
jgi:hypothetical protein